MIVIIEVCFIFMCSYWLGFLNYRSFPQSELKRIGNYDVVIFLFSIAVLIMEDTYFKLSRRKIKVLFVYFSFLLLIGLISSLFALNYELFCKLNITIVSLIGGIATSLMGSTVFYMRKLYKSAITSIVTAPSTEDDKTKETGLFFYYLFRPVFAITFSILIHIALKASVAIITVKESNLDSGMIYLTMLLSFFIGFSAGDVLHKLEKASKEIANKSIEKLT